MIRAALTDTHALIWSSFGPERKLGVAAKRAFAAAMRGEMLIYVSVVSLVEIAEALHAGRISYDLGFDAWMEQYFSHRQFRALDLTSSIVRRSHSLYAIPERGDRLLAASALEMGCPLITRDAAITRSGLTPTLW